MRWLQTGNFEPFFPCILHGRANETEKDRVAYSVHVVSSLKRSDGRNWFPDPFPQIRKCITCLKTNGDWDKAREREREREGEREKSALLCHCFASFARFPPFVSRFSWFLWLCTKKIKAPPPRPSIDLLLFLFLTNLCLSEYIYGLVFSSMHAPVYVYIESPVIHMYANIAAEFLKVSRSSVYVAMAVTINFSLQVTPTRDHNTMTYPSRSSFTMNEAGIDHLLALSTHPSMEMSSWPSYLKNSSVSSVCKKGDLFLSQLCHFLRLTRAALHSLDLSFKSLSCIERERSLATLRCTKCDDGICIDDDALHDCRITVRCAATIAIQRRIYWFS